MKRKASFRRITIPPLIHRAFEQWKAQCANTSADALVFPSEKTGRPMWPGVFLQKRIQPIAKTLGITVPVTFQVLRRSCTTLNQKNGSLKDVQVHMGHGSIETTGNVYMMEIPDSLPPDGRTRRDRRDGKRTVIMNTTEHKSQRVHVQVVENGGPGQSRTADQRFRKPPEGAYAVESTARLLRQNGAIAAGGGKLCLQFAYRFPSFPS